MYEYSFRTESIHDALAVVSAAGAAASQQGDCDAIHITSGELGVIRVAITTTIPMEALLAVIERTLGEPDAPRVIRTVTSGDVDTDRRARDLMAADDWQERVEKTFAGYRARKITSLGENIAHGWRALAELGDDSR